MKVKRISVFSATLVLMVFVLTSNLYAQKSQEVIKWRMQTAWPPAYVLQKTAEQFVQNVKKSTGGRLDITLLPGGAVVSGLDLLKTVSKGVLDAGQSAFIYHAGIDPAFELLGVVPFEGDIYNILLWYYGGGGKSLVQELLRRIFYYYLTGNLWQNIRIISFKSELVRWWRT